jgi:hypothetical protein
MDGINHTDDTNDTGQPTRLAGTLGTFSRSDDHGHTTAPSEAKPVAYWCGITFNCCTDPRKH